MKLSIDPKAIDDGVRAQFDGNFLDATDIQCNGDASGVTVEISGVVPPNTEKDNAGKQINKTILSFKGAKKRLIINKVNARVLCQLHGKKASEWVGKKVTLVVRYLEKAFGQFNVPVIRIKTDEAHPLTFGMRKHYGSEKPYKSE